MASEGEFPKVDGDVLYASEVNSFNGFGDGSDGAFDETSGTTNLTQGTIYQYSSFNLDTSATLSASSTSQNPIIILVQGNVVINGTIDLSGKGSTSSYASYAGTKGTNGSTGDGSGGAGGSGGIAFGFGNLKFNIRGSITNGVAGGTGAAGHGSYPVDGGGGGGGGPSSDTDGSNGSNGSTGGATGSSGTPGTPGDGGCTFILICGGTISFGASSTIDCSGADSTASTGRAGGSGGSGAGDILIFHNGAKTDNGLTTDVTAGAAGATDTGGGAGGSGSAGNVKIEDYDSIIW